MARPGKFYIKQVLQNSHRRTSDTPKHMPVNNPIESSSFAAFLRAANPSSVAYKAEAEVSELNKVERSMQSAFSDFETKLKAVHSKINWI